MDSLGEFEDEDAVTQGGTRGAGRFFCGPVCLRIDSKDDRSLMLDIDGLIPMFGK